MDKKLTLLTAHLALSETIIDSWIHYHDSSIKASVFIDYTKCLLDEGSQRKFCQFNRNYLELRVLHTISVSFVFFLRRSLVLGLEGFDAS